MPRSLRSPPGKSGTVPAVKEAKDDWLSFIEKEWTKRIVNNTKGRERWVEAQYRKVYPLPSWCDANILMEDMFSEIRKGHEADVSNRIITTDQFRAATCNEMARLKADLATCKDVGNRLMKRNSELEDKIFKLENQDYSKYCLSCDRQARISDLIRQLESKCKECVDLRLELEARLKKEKVR